MSKGKWTKPISQAGYVKNYDYEEIRGTVVSVFQCSYCHRQWYSKDSIGFLQCPYCKVQRDIQTKIDTSHGKLPIAKFNGEEYSNHVPQ